MPDSEVRDSYLKDSKRWDRIKQKDLVSLYYEVKQSLDFNSRYHLLSRLMTVNC